MRFSEIASPLCFQTNICVIILSYPFCDYVQFGRKPDRNVSRLGVNVFDTEDFMNGNTSISNTELLMIRTTRKRLTFVVLGLTLAIVPFAGEASAQATGDRTGANTGTTTTRTDRDDNGFNPGWLGLIGLAGLTGLMPKKNHTVTTHRTGDAPSR